MNKKILVIIDGWSSCEKIRHKPYWVKHGDVRIAELDEAVEKIRFVLKNEAKKKEKI